MKVRAAMLAAICLASCSTTQLPRMPMLTGDESSLLRLEEAARACGAEWVSIERDGRRWLGIGPGYGLRASRRSTLCVREWVKSRPLAELLHDEID